MFSEFVLSYATTSFLCSLLPLLVGYTIALWLRRRYKRQQRILRIIFSFYGVIYVCCYSSMLDDAVAIFGNVMLAQTLISCGAAVDSAHLVLGHTPLLMAAGSGQADMVEFLLTQGAQPNAANSYGYTALWKAVTEGHTVVVQHLARAGANIEVRNNQGRSALMEACDMGDRDMVVLLVLSSAALDAQDNNGNTALHLASNRGHASIAAVLLKHGTFADAVNEAGATPLMFAARGGYIQCVKLLLDGGADPHRQVGTDEEGRVSEKQTALEIAREMAEWPKVGTLKKEAIMEVVALLEAAAVWQL